jgi:copper(I)-binding protein
MRIPPIWRSSQRRLLLTGVGALIWLGWSGDPASRSYSLTPLVAHVAAHDFTLGPLRIDHPYATPTPPGATTGAAYLRGIRNSGEKPDRLVGARTPVARTVEIHRSVIDAQNVMRMRAVDGIDLPPKSGVRLRHGGEHHLMLIDLKVPLKIGDRFSMTLRFEKAGEREVMVWVQQPRNVGDTHEHRH